MADSRTRTGHIKDEPGRLIVHLAVQNRRKSSKEPIMVKVY